MNDFDKYLKIEAQKEQTEVPESVKIRIEQTLADLPEKESSVKQFRVLPRIAAVAACFIFVLIFLLMLILDKDSLHEIQ